MYTAIVHLPFRAAAVSDCDCAAGNYFVRCTQRTSDFGKTWQVVLGCGAYIRARGSAVGTQGRGGLKPEDTGPSLGIGLHVCSLLYGGMCVLGGVRSAVCEGVSHVRR